MAVLSMVRHLRVYDSASTTRYACALPLIEDMPTRPALETTRAALQRTLEFAPTEARTWLHIGKISCLIGDYETAISTLRGATQLDAHNTSSNAELGFAIDSLCQDTYMASAQGASTDVPHCSSALLQERLTSWQHAGLDRGSFHLLAQQALKSGHVEDALRWYQRSAVLCLHSAESCSSLFALGVCTLAQDGHLSGDFPSNMIPTMPLDAALEISPGNLRWMRESEPYDLSYGEPLNNRSPKESDYGVLWWNSSAVVVIDVRQEADYDITLVARHSNARPATLLLEHNFVPVARFMLDDTRREYNTTVHLQSGSQVLGAHYPKDIGDAELYTIRISRISSKNHESGT